MNLKVIASFAVIGFFLLGFAEGARASQIQRLDIDTGSGFDTLQEPFSEFLQNASEIDIRNESGSSQPIFLTRTEEAKKSWQEANAWLKEKTGLDVWGILKAIGNILVFIMNLAIWIMAGLIRAIQWLVSLIPSTNASSP